MPIWNIFQDGTFSERHTVPHSANLKHVSGWHIFQNGTQCQSETCFRMAHFQNGTQMPLAHFRHATHFCLYRLIVQFSCIVYIGLQFTSWKNTGFTLGEMKNRRKCCKVTASRRFYSNVKFILVFCYLWSIGIYNAELFCLCMQNSRHYQIWQN